MRLLMLAPFPPTRGARHGGGQALHGLLSALSRRHEIVLVHLGGGEQTDPELAARCVAVHAVNGQDPGRWPARARSALALARGRTLWAADPAFGAMARRASEVERAFRPAVIQVEHAFLGDAMPMSQRDALRLVTIHDPASSQRENLRLPRPGFPLVHRLSALATERQEKRVLSSVDAAVTFTERDRRLLVTSAPPTTEVVVVPLAVDIPSEPCDPAGTTSTVLFVGGFSHPPNVEAALRLGRRIMPTIRSLHPDATLELVGEAPPPEVLALAGPQIRVTGAVDSVVPFLDRAAVVVAPIAMGGGMRVKVLEALAAGKAVVTSTRGAEGIAVRSGEHLLIVDEDDEFASAVSTLLADETARRRLGTAARAWAKQEISWEATADRYETLYLRGQHARRGRQASGTGDRGQDR